MVCGVQPRAAAISAAGTNGAWGLDDKGVTPAPALPRHGNRVANHPRGQLLLTVNRGKRYGIHNGGLGGAAVVTVEGQRITPIQALEVRASGAFLFVRVLNLTVSQNPRVC